MTRSAQKTVELLVEIRTEDMPPDDLTEIFASSLRAAMQERHYELLVDGNYRHVAWTPRRFALGALARPLAKPLRGPAKANAYQDDGKPSKALAGFLRAVNAKKSELITEEHKGKEYVVVYPRRELHKDIGKILEDALLGMVLPRKMRWNAAGGSYSFVRRITGATVFIDDKFIPAKIFGKQASPSIRGHRFIEGNKSSKLEGSSWTKYVARLAKLGVIGNAADRVNKIVAIASSWLNEPSLSMENSLLAGKLANMCEYPAGIDCTFAKKYLELPAALINVVGRKHICAFTAFQPHSEEELSCNFLFIADRKKLGAKQKKQIRRGVENVMQARLDDALFLYQQDSKLSEAELLSRLERIDYVAGLGSMSNRCARIEKLAVAAAKMMELDEGRIGLVAQAARLCKADLGTQLVNEIPELEGKIVGSILKDSQHEALFSLIETHLDRDFDKSSTMPARTCLVLALELERLVANVAVRRLRSTGAGDRSGIRRSSMRINTLLFGNAAEFKGDFYKLIDLAFELAGEDVEKGFFKKRDQNEVFADAKCYLRSYLGKSLLGFLGRHAWHIPAHKLKNVVPASSLLEEISRFADPNNQASTLFVADIAERYASVASYAYNSGGENIEKIIGAVKRLANIAEKSSNMDAVAENLLQEASEKSLFAACTKLKQECDEHQKDRKYTEMLAGSYRLVSEVNKFFDEVMINAEDDKIRRNRLALVKMTLDQMLRIAS